MGRNYFRSNLPSIMLALVRFFCNEGPTIGVFSTFLVHLTARSNSVLNFEGDFFGECLATANSAGIV